jgi:hypothetical protein
MALRKELLANLGVEADDAFDADDSVGREPARAI